MARSAPGGAPARVAARRLARERMLHRRRRLMLLVVLSAALLIVGIDMARGGTHDPPDTASPVAKQTARTAAVAHPVRPAPSAGRSAAPAVSYPRAGSHHFRTAAGRTKVYGHSGTLLRFQVAVETDIQHLDLADFADRVTAILGDRQGWTAGGEWRFQRVGPGDPHDFTLYLVTPDTRDSMCHDNPEGFTSCRYGDHVMINVSRWVHGVPYYRDLDSYRNYAISHEVGHRLGHGHELCPGKGRPAPTMQQQTLGLHGCLANPWPYPHGRAYDGPAGEYPQTDIPSDPPSYYTH